MEKEKKLVEQITSMEEDFAQWYTDVVKKAELIDYTSVKGCMAIKPAGYAIWENIQAELDRRFKATGVENVYMPLFIPESMLRCRRDSACVRHPRHSSVISIKMMSIHTATCRRSTTSGVPWCAGKRRHARSCARESFCGRKAIPAMLPGRRPWSAQSRC